jgi:hypothetical protein
MAAFCATDYPPPPPPVAWVVRQHGGLPPYSDGPLSWSWGSEYPPYSGQGYPGYNSTGKGDKHECTSDYISGGSEQPQSQPCSCACIGIGSPCLRYCVHGASIGGAVCPDNSTELSEFIDYQVLTGMLTSLHFASSKHNKSGVPFFLSYGIHRPHLPFHFPAVFPGMDGQPLNIWEALGPDEQIPLPLHPRAPVGMPPIAFTYEMDGSKSITVSGQRYPIPGPNWAGSHNESSGGGCPYCGPALPDHATRLMRKGCECWLATPLLSGFALSGLDGRL